MGFYDSIQFNEHMFLFMGVTLALTFIVYGLILTQKRPPDAPQKHWLAHRRWTASVLMGGKSWRASLNVAYGKVLLFILVHTHVS